jgi:hypothetical protein
MSPCLRRPTLADVFRLNKGGESIRSGLQLTCLPDANGLPEKRVRLNANLTPVAARKVLGNVLNLATTCEKWEVRPRQSGNATGL